MQLKEGTLLQNGEYKIIKVLGQGGFGITYLAEQTSLRRKVAIKEFFMKEYCERDRESSSVSLGTSGSKELVEKFREKFVKEAQIIAGFNHNNIIKIYNVFEENNTAYYVMDYYGKSLSEYLSQKKILTEGMALMFIRQIASALSYIHSRNFNHLDVKPGNVLLDNNNNAVLIDFGLTKHYDNDGGQTSSTPVGISRGYAPLEQYKQGGVSTFSPETDIYSLGATLYKLVTGITPPEADEIYENGINFPKDMYLSESVKGAIIFAMQPKRKDRPQSIEVFLKILEVKAESGEETCIDVTPKPKSSPNPRTNSNTSNGSHSGNVKISEENKSNKKGCLIFFLILAIILGVVGYVDYKEKERAGIEAAYNKKQKDKQNYLTLIKDGDELLASGYYTESIDKYRQALAYEKQYSGTTYSTEFSKGMPNKITVAEQRQKEAQARLEKERKEREQEAAARAERERKEREAAAKEKEKQDAYKHTHGYINGMAYVDLGLPSGIKWATCNIGAYKPENYGSYYAWGEIKVKATYEESNCVTLGKYYNDIRGNSQCDAARANWGNSWRLPSKTEWEELKQKCSWKWTTLNGVNGYNITGPNGNSIFLPVAGCYVDSSLNYNIGYYWSSMPYDNNNAYYICFDNYYKNVLTCGRQFGMTIRPVSY